MILSRRDGIIAGVVTFIAWGYTVHWAPTLRWTPHAFVAGFALAIGGFIAIILLTSRGISYPRKISRYRTTHVAFVTSKLWAAEVAALKLRSAYKRKPLYPSSFVISDGIDSLLDLVLRDFVTSWYGSISKDPSFINEVDRATCAALVNIRDRLFSIDLVEVAISRFVPIITAHFKDFCEAERTVRGKYLNRNVTESEELDLAIAARYRNGNLHPAATLLFSNTQLAQQQHLRKVVETILPQVMPEEMIRSRSVFVLIREIVACALLLPIMQMLSEPDTWNQMMEAYGRTMLQDRKTVRRLRAALDEHASPTPKSKMATAFPRLAPRDNERKFEKFIRAIRQCHNLSDARRFRSEISRQLKRESLVEGQDLVYIRRLETGKRLLDQKVTQLSAGTGSAGPAARPGLRKTLTTSRLESASLVEVLRDAAGCSYFMEYMDRQRLMSLVQFWVVVDGLRNPLEDDLLESSDTSNNPQSWSDTDRSDLALINEGYLSRPELKVPDYTREVVRKFLAAGRRATLSQYQDARGAVLRAQTAVLEDMERRHFPNFRKSDLYYKYLTSDESSTPLAISTPARLPSPPPRTSTRMSGAKYSALANVPPRMNSKGSELQRQALSSTDLTAIARLSEELAPPRRSLESTASSPLFDDDYDNDPLARSRSSFEREAGTKDSGAGANEKVVEAMEAALNDIMEQRPSLEDSRGSLFDPPPANAPLFQDNDSLDSVTVAPTGPRKDKNRPNISSLGLVSEPSRFGVFSEDDLFPEEGNFLSDEYEEPEESDNEKSLEEEIQQAAPGDLGLTEAITALSSDIEKLTSQDSIIDSLLRKAELTNNNAELRILRKSRASLEREIQRKTLQRQQYIVQESDNSLYGRSGVEIKSVVVGTDDEGKEYALYVIEVHRDAGEKMPAATWAIARRYSEFHSLHQRLRAKYPSVRQLDFPRRRVVMKLQRDFLHKRRLSLQHYLRELLQLPDVCSSRDLRAFLSQQAIIPTDGEGQEAQKGDIVTRIYNSVADGMEDFLGNIPVLDQLSLAGQNLVSAATTQLSQTSSAVSGDPVAAEEAEKEMNAFENREIVPFVKPICDIFLEIFELNKGNNWLRGRAVVVVLHQLLGGTIEKKVRENVQTLLQEEAILRYINLVKDTMWPGGEMRKGNQARSSAEKTRSKLGASLMLASLVPDLAGNVVGRTNAQAASRKIFATLNNHRLNTHLAFTLFDEIVKIIFGDMMSLR
ncbi:hypothetical protein L228DRAFT_216608 [Xylona heveae TC161]|uniref:Intermediate filament protein n=1 Tax=Xylona heveae (strain CBS 132557 / TC161) TaxID=1328760 RepID=A0A165JLE7_XYLHT|nr:hypothetical protein L228DRAFT_216608 [Xylona heveae TC161]KZF26385.1 hypothetical protein L228DRAFT_216608 [Xylona heveae TC161]